MNVTESTGQRFAIGDYAVRVFEDDTTIHLTIPLRSGLTHVLELPEDEATVVSVVLDRALAWRREHRLRNLPDAEA